MSRAYYNEIDPFAAQWLRNLIAAGHIAPGDVDERSIEDVTPNELKGYTQCHFFAGIGVWSYALRRAGWADDQQVWTGSCPCQPFSTSGKRAGFSDERHLWPSWLHLISQCKPGVVFGEQVASPDGLAWLDLVSSDLEASEYAFTAVDLCAAGIGAPHIRQRLWFVADANSDPGRWDVAGLPTPQGEDFTRLDNRSQSGDPVSPGPLVHTESRGCQQAGDAITIKPEWPCRASRPVGGFWGDAEWIEGRNGQYRAIEPGTFPLVDGIAESLGRGKHSLGGMAIRNREGRLRGYGNAINAELATLFISAHLDILQGSE